MSLDLSPSIWSGKIHFQEKTTHWCQCWTPLWRVGTLSTSCQLQNSRRRSECSHSIENSPNSRVRKWGSNDIRRFQWGSCAATTLSSCFETIFLRQLKVACACVLHVVGQLNGHFHFLANVIAIKAQNMHISFRDIVHDRRQSRQLLRKRES